MTDTFDYVIIGSGTAGSVIAGHVAVQGMIIYDTSKFAVVGMSEALAGDLRHFGVGVSVLCPGFVNTGIYSSERNRPAR